MVCAAALAQPHTPAISTPFAASGIGVDIAGEPVYQSQLLKNKI